MIHSQRIRIVSSSNARLPDRPHVAGQSGSARGTKAWDAGFEEPTKPAAAHLLIAEDDPDMRRFLVECFRDEGYRVTEAEDGGELRRRLHEATRSPGAGAPDILVSDIRLPGFTGLELLADLRKSDWLLPVILITAFGDESVHDEGARLGAAMVLDKPFDVEDLVDAVRTLVPAE
jgi:DNA-binding response OmpR family regulator